MMKGINLTKLNQIDYRHHCMTVCHNPPLRHVCRRGITAIMY